LHFGQTSRCSKFSPHRGHTMFMEIPANRAIFPVHCNYRLRPGVRAQGLGVSSQKSGNSGRALILADRSPLTPCMKFLVGQETA
jgi:hypothetical protein